MAVVSYINGFRHELSAAPDLSASLNDYIRRQTPYKGTKLACGEGGCGACAVQATRYDPATDKLVTTSINSCLCPIGSLDGVAITTVEGLGNSVDGFSKVQEKFASHHASQCGFCTPGFVVACHATLQKCKEQGETPTPAIMQTGLDGNLCRCTGYRPILDACKSLAAEWDMEDLCTAQPAASAFPEELKRYLQAKHAQSKTKKAKDLIMRELRGDTLWVAPTTLKQVFKELDAHKGTEVRLLAGNTAAGVYHDWPTAPVIIDVKGVEGFKTITRDQHGLTFGAAVPFAEVIQELRRNVEDQPAPEAWMHMADHIERIAGSHVRWAATVGGNAALTRDPAHYLESDFMTVLNGAGGKVAVSSRKEIRWLSVPAFLDGNTALDLGKSELITAVRFPVVLPGDRFWSHKVAQRFYNSHALVNMAVWTRHADGNGIAEARIAVGCPTLFREGKSCDARVAWQCRRAYKAEQALAGGPLGVHSPLAALEALEEDIVPGTTMDADAGFYRKVAEGLLFQALAPLLPSTASSNPALQRLLKARAFEPPQVPAGQQEFQPPPKDQEPVGLPIEKDRVRLQASGEAVYSSDVAVGDGKELYAAVVGSTEALATIESIEISDALKIPGVVAFVGADDVPKDGMNRVNTGGGEAEIFASKKVQYVAQPIGLVLAETPELAIKGASLVKVEYGFPKSLGTPIFTIPDAIAAGSFYEVPGNGGEVVRVGDVEKAFAEAPHVIRNAKYSLPSQQHFYMETQTTVAQPQEAGGMLVTSSTQTLDGVQSAVAAALGIPYHSVTAVCRRAGGGFGGKAARSLPVAAAAAVAAHKTRRTVRYALSRNDDFRQNGGRCETDLEYDVAFDDGGRISALSVRGWFLCGGDLDLGWNDLFILKVGADQVYDIPNIELDLKLVRTNLAPRTIMRGPGFMNSVMIIEEVMERVAAFLGADRAVTRQLNFLKSPETAVPAEAAIAAEVAQEEVRAPQARLVDEVAGACVRGSSQRSQMPGICGRAQPASNDRLLAAGMMKTSLSRPFKADLWTLPRIWEELQVMADFDARVAAVEEFNRLHAWRKRGISINPCRFDCAPSPTNAAVNIYHDGSILVTHGGLECGQGLSTKVKQMAVFELSKLLPAELRPLPLSLVRINHTSTDILPNAGPTWSSTTSEATCAAVQEACKQLVDSLAPFAKDVQGDSGVDVWRGAIVKAQPDPSFGPAAVPLSAFGFFDGSERGKEGKRGSQAARGFLGLGSEQLSYSSFGAAISEVEIDLLTGEKLVLSSHIHYDCGQSLNPAVDMGQVEGAFIQGLGYLTSEEVVIDKDTGKLFSDGTWTYKIPSAACIPQQLNVNFLKDSPNPRGIMSSKASGEPSLLLTTSILYAIRHALVAAHKEIFPSETPTRAIVPSSPRGPLDLAQGRQTGIDRAQIGDKEKCLMTSGRDENYFVFSAPATTARLKMACGDFSVAAILKAALEEAESSSDAEDWVLLANS